MTAALFSGCLSPRTDQTRFYVLSTPTAEPPAAVESKQVFLVGLRITAVEYLRTRQMIEELGGNELRLSEENVWQEMPQAGFVRVLAHRFAEKLPNCQLIFMPSTTTNMPELILEVELRALQGRLGPPSEAEVSAEIRLLDANSRLLERHRLRQTAPWGSTRTHSYSSLAAAESRAAAELADAMADRVLACHRNLAK